MSFLLDSNTYIQFLNQRSEGLERTRRMQQTVLERYTLAPFDDQAAESYAKIGARLERAGTPIGANDLLIAAIALSKSSW